MQTLGILIASCDKNEWLLKVFFEQFKKFWPQCPYKIYLSMERKTFDYQDIDIISITHETEIGWCERTKRALQQMQEDYVLVLLDDFIIEEQVNECLLEYYLGILRDNNLSNIILTPVLNERNYSICMYESLYHRHRFGRYKTSLQCGLWRKSILEELLIAGENAWEFEIFANIRSFLLKDSFYAVKNNKCKPIVYNDGFFVVQGRVNLIEKKRLEKKLGIEIDIGNALSFEKEIIRDDIKFVPRVIRRLKIMVKTIIYRCKFYRLRRPAMNSQE